MFKRALMDTECKLILIFFKMVSVVTCKLLFQGSSESNDMNTAQQAILDVVEPNFTSSLIIYLRIQNYQ